jgi:hypothetical protein
MDLVRAASRLRHWPYQTLHSLMPPFRLMNAASGSSSSFSIFDEAGLGPDGKDLRKAIRSRNTAALFDYLVAALSYQGCQSATKFGSDLLLMKSAGGDVLICGENQHHASIVAAILVGTQRFCCCECSPRFREDHDHGSCVEGIFGMSILRYRFAARAQSVPSSGRRPAAVGKKR